MSEYNPASGLIASVGSGVGGAIAFNWFDKAQYLAIKHKRPFFRHVNFERPMQGTLNSITSKIISNGLYFFWIDYFRDNINKHTNLSPVKTEFLAGNISGILTAVVSNPISAVKYRNWDKQWPASKVISRMYSDNGIKPFFKGTMSRIYRDSTFSCVYVMSHYYGKKQLGDTRWLFLSDNLAVMGATIISSPFNYTMNRMYAVKPYEQCPSTMTFLRKLYYGAIKQERPLVYVINRMHVGVGTVRISLGITISHRMYNYFYGVVETDEFELF
jgi:hypothetical protein